MAGTLEVYRLRAVLSLQDKMSPGLKTAITRLGGMTAALGAATVAIGAMVRRAGEVERIRVAFDRLSKSAGILGDELLRNTQEATKGLVSEFDLLTAANQALLLGLPVTADSFAEMAKGAVTMGQAVGKDAVESINDLIEGVGRMSTEQLDNLGLQVRVGEASEKYAASIGKTAKELTDAEKKLAFYKVTMEQVRAGTERLGDVQVTTADAVTQLQIKLGDLSDRMLTGIAPSLLTAVEAADRVLTFFTDWAEGVETLTSSFDKLLTQISLVARALPGVGEAGAAALLAIQSASGRGVFAQRMPDTPWAMGPPDRPGQRAGAVAGAGAGVEETEMKMVYLTEKLERTRGQMLLGVREALRSVDVEMVTLDVTMDDLLKTAEQSVYDMYESFEAAGIQSGRSFKDAFLSTIPDLAASIASIIRSGGGKMSWVKLGIGIASTIANIVAPGSGAAIGLATGSGVLSGGFQEGSGGIRDFGPGTIVPLHGREAVVKEETWLAAIREAAAGSQSGMGGSVTVELDGDVLAQSNLARQADAADLRGFRARRSRPTGSGLRVALGT